MRRAVVVVRFTSTLVAKGGGGPDAPRLDALTCAPMQRAAVTESMFDLLPVVALCDAPDEVSSERADAPVVFRLSEGVPDRAPPLGDDGADDEFADPRDSARARSSPLSERARALSRVVGLRGYCSRARRRPRRRGAQEEGVTVTRRLDMCAQRSF